MDVLAVISIGEISKQALYPESSYLIPTHSKQFPNSFTLNTLLSFAFLVNPIFSLHIGHFRSHFFGLAFIYKVMLRNLFLP